jgi:crotonobetainyl-CoA:carnitine CoA-transferase CaiB-like acyl-CoA transferase
MLECMAEWMGYPLYYAFEGADPPPRAGAAHATIYPYGPFPTGDGKAVMLGIQNEREWALFCERVLRQPALAADPRFAGNAARSAARDALRAIIVETFAALTAEQAIERLEAAQIANAHMNELADVWSHAQLAARERWFQVGTSAGPVPALRPPGFASEEPVRREPVPALGEHTDRVLAELGYGSEAIASLRAAGAV